MSIPVVQQRVDKTGIPSLNCPILILLIAILRFVPDCFPEVDDGILSFTDLLLLCITILYRRSSHVVSHSTLDMPSAKGRAKHNTALKLPARIGLLQQVSRSGQFQYFAPHAPNFYLY